MRKIILTVILILSVMMNNSSGQLSEDSKSQNMFHSFFTKTTESEYQMTGTAYLSSRRNLVEAEVSADTEISITGTLERKEGEIKLLIEDRNGNLLHL